MELHPSDLALPRDADASGRDLGAPELAALAQVVASGTLTTTKGSFARRLERAFATRAGGGGAAPAAAAVACASGTAAIHAALGALRLESGDEVITSAITDLGAIMPILYEGAAPVFCDVDPDSALVTATRIAARITPHTRAIIVTHLFGQVCAMGPIAELAARHRLALIEDCAQAPLAEDCGRRAGTFGVLAAYSLQQTKHMTCGEGGLVVGATPAWAAHARKCVDKGFGYGEADPDHDVPALNLRMSELQAAVALAQLGKLEAVIARRRALAQRFAELFGEVEGLALPRPRPGCTHDYWRYCIMVDPGVVAGGAGAVARALAARGIAAAAHYIGKPAWQTRVLREWRRFPVTRLPYEAAGRTPEPPPDSMPGTARALARMLVLPWNEHYTEAHLRGLAAALRGAVRARASGAMAGNG